MRSTTFVIAFCLLAGSQLASAELPPNYKDAVIEGAQIVWAAEGSKPVGFDKTHSGIVDMLALMSSPMYKEKVEADPFMSGIKRLLERFDDACTFDKSKCLSVFPAIEQLKEEFEDNVNVIPYLAGCEQRQSDFCSGRSEEKPNPVASFFGKIATICSPKDKKCESKKRE